MGFGFRGFGFRVQGLGFRGFGFRGAPELVKAFWRSPARAGMASAKPRMMPSLRPAEAGRIESSCGAWFRI